MAQRRQNVNPISEEIIKNIKANWRMVLEPDGRGKGAVCPACGSGSGKHGTGLSEVPGTDGELKCFACGQSHDVIHWHCIKNGLDPTGDFKRAVSECAALIGISLDQPAVNNHTAMKKIYDSAAMSSVAAERKAYFAECAARLDQTDYRRGLSEETLKHFHVGFDPNWKHPDWSKKCSPTPRLIIPVNEIAYIARLTREPQTQFERDKSKVKVSKPYKLTMFNAEALKSEVVIAVEGEIDAMSIFDVGFHNVIGLGSISMVREFFNQLDLYHQAGNPYPRAVIVALDNEASDNAKGAANVEKAHVNMRKGLTERGINYVDGTGISGECKDANELLNVDREQLKRNVQALIDQAQSIPSPTKIIALNSAVAQQTAPPEHTHNLPPLPPELGIDVSAIQIPNEFRLDQDGVWQYVKVGRGQWIWKQISTSALLVIGVEQNLDANTYKTHIAGFCKGLGWRLTPEAVDDAVLASSQKIIDLARFGLDINSVNAKSVIQFISSFKAINSQLIPRHKTVSRVGWRVDGSFVYPNPQSNSATLDGALRRQYGDLFASHGDPSKVDALLNQLRNNPTAMLVIGSALAAPAVHLLKAQNIAVHVFGKSGCGKSTLEKLALSLFIDPNAKSALPTANFTKAGAEYFFDSRYDLPAIIDDINSVSDERSRQSITDLPYQFVNGAGRLRGTKNGGNARLVDFRGSLITSGERPLTTSQSSAGGKRRLIEHAAPEGLLSRELITNIHRIIADNYGIHGRQFVDFLAANDVAPELQAEVRQRRQLRLREFYDVLRYGDGGFDIGNGLYDEHKSKVPLHIDTIAAIAATLTAFFIRDGNGSSSGDIHNDELLYWSSWASAILTALPDENEIADWQRAAAWIADWVASHPGNFSNLNDKGQTFNPYSSQSFGVTRRVKDSDNTEHEQFCIIPTVVTTALDNAGFPADMVIKQLAEHGFIDRPDRNHIKRLVKINGRPQRFLVFHSDRLFPKNLG